jgi:prolyl-tRNA editing enzyme YbaK/EbsC (Cys-tRNA(Pro) deacylase)
MADLIDLKEFTPAALAQAIREAGFDVDLFESTAPMPTVPLAAAARNVAAAEILKTLIFEDRAGDLVRVIASGPDRIDRNRLAELAGLDHPKMAVPERVLAATGWPAGGVSPVGSILPLRTFIDQAVMAHARVYGGGGTEFTLIGMAPGDILTITGGTVARLTA